MPILEVPIEEVSGLAGPSARVAGAAPAAARPVARARACLRAPCTHTFSMGDASGAGVRFVSVTPAAGGRVDVSKWQSVAALGCAAHAAGVEGDGVRRLRWAVVVALLHADLRSRRGIVPARDGAADYEAALLSFEVVRGARSTRRARRAARDSRRVLRRAARCGARRVLRRAARAAARVAAAAMGPAPLPPTPVAVPRAPPPPPQAPVATLADAEARRLARAAANRADMQGCAGDDGC